MSRQDNLWQHISLYCFTPHAVTTCPVYGLVVTVDGSWEIPDSFLVTWYNNEMRRIWDKRDVILQDHV